MAGLSVEVLFEICVCVAWGAAGDGDRASVVYKVGRQAI